jgi:hypothetical protein
MSDMWLWVDLRTNTNKRISLKEIELCTNYLLEYVSYSSFNCQHDWGDHFESSL